jgi:Protein tyrosine and serine/threonine kinase
VILLGNKDLCGAPLTKPCDSSSGQPPLPPSSNSLNKALIAVLVIVSVGFILSLIVICILLPKWRQKHNEDQLKTQFLAPLPSAPSRKHNVEFMDPIEKSRTSAGSGGKRPRRDEPGKLSFVKEDGQRFELEDLLRASAELLGSGDLWASYKAALFDGPSFVVKKLKEKHGIGREDFQEHMWRLGRLSHPNLLPIVAYIHKKEEKMIITDYVPNGSLAHMLHSKIINHKIFSNSYIRLLYLFHV